MIQAGLTDTSSRRMVRCCGHERPGRWFWYEEKKKGKVVLLCAASFSLPPPLSLSASHLSALHLLSLDCYLPYLRPLPPLLLLFHSASLYVC